MVVKNRLVFQWMSCTSPTQKPTYLAGRSWEVTPSHQVLSGHACFNAYLERFWKVNSANVRIAAIVPIYAIFECITPAEVRANFNEVLRDISIIVKHLISMMLKEEYILEAVPAYIMHTMQENRRRQKNGEHKNTAHQWKSERNWTLSRSDTKAIPEMFTFWTSFFSITCYSYA
uniref:Uncharacterized protein n=1 Tax=Vespula pensylvanica TaxID=30213 RepID=A0A834UGG3_VESPE|nr:hypothetical protein H0235_001087 [Vespula pensylvanica]